MVSLSVSPYLAPQKAQVSNAARWGTGLWGGSLGHCGPDLALKEVSAPCGGHGILQASSPKEGARRDVQGERQARMPWTLTCAEEVGRGPLSAGLLLKMVGGPAQIIKMQSRGAPDPPPRPAPPFPLAVYQLNLARMKGSGGHPSGLGGTWKKSHQRVSVVASLAACSL